jgi:hypothetical protein
MSDTVRATVLGNAGTLIVFRVSSNDTAILAPEFHRCRRMSLPTRARSGHGVGQAMLAIGRYPLNRRYFDRAIVDSR